MRGSSWVANWTISRKFWSFLVGGLEHVLFFHILGIIIPSDFHIFQRGRSTTNQFLVIFWSPCLPVGRKIDHPMDGRVNWFIHREVAGIFLGPGPLDRRPPGIREVFVNNVGKTMPYTTHDWELFRVYLQYAPIFLVM